MKRADIDFIHTLNAERDAVFLRQGPRESLWLQKLKPGDRIVCCHGCRKVFYADDWVDACPLCADKEPLYFFLGANQLLWRERIVQEEGAVECPMRALRIRKRTESTRFEAEINRLETEIGRLTAEEERVYMQIREARNRKWLLFRQSAIAGGGVLAVLMLAFAISRWFPF